MSLLLLAVAVGLLALVSTGLSSHLQLHYAPSSTLWRGLLAQCPSLFRPLKLPLGSVSAVYDTVIPIFTRKRLPVHVNREELFVKADFPFLPGAVTLHWSQYDLPREAPILVVLPGLTGGVEAHYMEVFINFFAQQPAYRLCLVSYRGASNTSLYTPQVFNAEYTQDIAQVLEFLHMLYPHSRIYAVGFSMGANLLLKYLEKHQDAPLTAAMCVCPPFNLLESGILLQSRWLYRSLFSGFLARKLTRFLFSKMRQVRFRGVDVLNEKGQSAIRNLHDFDHCFTIKNFGYASVAEYHKDCASSTAIRNIRLPLLCCVSRNDPMCAFSSVPVREFRANPNVCLAVSSFGGHNLLWYEKDSLRQSRARIAEIAREFLDALERKHSRVEFEHKRNSLLSALRCVEDYTPLLHHLERHVRLQQKVAGIAFSLLRIRQRTAKILQSK